jgi:hypothetical protein
VDTAKNVIQKHYEFLKRPATKISFLGDPETFPDSFRSPADAGTTVRGIATVVFVDGTTEMHIFKVFMAKSDGWTNVEIVK